MKKFILMTLVTASALSPMAVYATQAMPEVVASVDTDTAADFQRGERRAERRAERQAERGQGNDEARAERRAQRQAERYQNNDGGQAQVERRQANPGYVSRAERQQNRAERRQEVIVPTVPVQTERDDRQRDVFQGQRREASQDGRYYDRNRDGNLDRRWDRNRDDRLDRNWDRNRDGRLDRRYDRNDDERIDRRYDQNRDGNIDRRYDRNNDNRVDRSYGGARVDRWSNNWRNDNRYDWRGHRQRYSNYYRPGRYYSPYRAHNYSRISIGFSLGSGYYGSRYWINDPWQYRLPAAYGSYRWVRYYDDVLLVDLRSGRVVDVIRDFFW